MTNKRLRGIELDPTADVTLPFLLMVAVAAAAGSLGAAFRGVEGFAFLPLLGVWAFLTALESYLVTTIFFVREVDLPQQIRWVEAAVMALLVGWLSSLPAGGFDNFGTWFGFGLLAWAWWFGQRIAAMVRPLHPATARSEARLGTEGKKHNDHGEAYDTIRTHLLGMLGAVGLVTGVADWAQGTGGFWGFTGASAGLLILALATAGALLVAARLRQQVTWAQEGLTPPPAVIHGWMRHALPILLVPVLLALVLPAGPRLPVERLLGVGKKAPTRLDLPPGPTMNEPPPKDPMVEALRQLSGDAIQWPAWLGKLLIGLVAAVIVALVAWVLTRAARQLAERAGKEELRGILAWLSALAALWLALLGALFGAARSALAVPAAALEGALSEAGPLGRYLPFTGRAPTDPRAAVRYFFARLQAEAARRRLGRAPAATAAEFARQLGGALPEQAEEAERLARAYEAARYGAEPVDPTQAGTARRAWIAITQALSRKR